MTGIAAAAVGGGLMRAIHILEAQHHTARGHPRIAGEDWRASLGPSAGCWSGCPQKQGTTLLNPSRGKSYPLAVLLSPSHSSSSAPSHDLSFGHESHYQFHVSGRDADADVDESLSAPELAHRQLPMP